MESFAKFEHEGWQRVAGKYDCVWASSTRNVTPVCVRQDYLRARRRQGCKQFNPPSRNRFVATPKATALPFPKQRISSRWARKKEWRKKRRESRGRRHEALFSGHYFV